MAERYAVKAGFWSDASTWNGGTLPGLGDTVHAGGFDVVIDQDVSVDGLSLAAGSSAPAGGRFIVDNTVTTVEELTITLAEGILAKHHQAGNGSTNGRTYVLRVLDGAPLVMLDAPVVEGGAGAYRNAVGVCVTGTAASGSGDATFVVKPGAVTPVAIRGGNGTGSYALVVDAGTVGVAGDITGGSNSSAYGMSVTGGTVTVTGDITGGSNTSTYGLSVTGGTVTVTGDITGGSSTSAFGMSVTGGTVTVTGDITGGSGTSAYGLYANGGTVTITGDITGGSGNNAYGMRVDAATALVRIDGTIYASEQTNGLSVTQAPNIAPAVKKLVNHPNGMSAMWAAKWIMWDADDFNWEAYTDAGWPNPETTKAYATRFGTNLPQQSDVRRDVTYGPNGTLTGTLDVTGGGGASLADIAAVTGAQIAAATNADD